MHQPRTASVTSTGVKRRRVENPPSSSTLPQLQKKPEKEERSEAEEEEGKQLDRPRKPHLKLVSSCCRTLKAHTASLVTKGSWAKVWCPGCKHASTAQKWTCVCGQLWHKCLTHAVQGFQLRTAAKARRQTQPQRLPALGRVRCSRFASPREVPRFHRVGPPRKFPRVRVQNFKRKPEAGGLDTKPTAIKAIRTNDGRAQPLVSQCVLQTQSFETIGQDLLFEKPGPGRHQSAPGVTKRPHSLTIQPPSAVDAGGGMQPQSMVVYRDCEGSECRESTTSSSYLGPDQDRTQEASVARPTKTARLHNSTRPIPMRNGKRTAKQVHEQAGRCMVNILARHPRFAARLNTSPAEVAPL